MFSSRGKFYRQLCLCGIYGKHKIYVHLHLTHFSAELLHKSTNWTHSTQQTECLFCPFVQKPVQFGFRIGFFFMLFKCSTSVAVTHMRNCFHSDNAHYTFLFKKRKCCSYENYGGENTIKINKLTCSKNEHFLLEMVLNCSRYTDASFIMHCVHSFIA